MIDCPNGEIRDKLPDFVHDQLDSQRRAEVSAHVAACAACAAEVTLLRELRASLRAAPPVDVGRIVAALPRSRRSTGASGHRLPERFSWRIAAAVAALAVGGGSAAVWNLYERGGEPENPPVAGPVLPRGGTGEEVQRVAAADLAIDADLAEASTVELESLLEELESFDGLPAGEPEPLLPSPGDEAPER